MAWYSIDMPEESVTNGGYHKLCRTFQKAFIGAGAPAEMALFAGRDAEPQTRRLYLSPSSSAYVPDLIDGYGAQPCSVPEERSVTLVYGVPGAKMLLSLEEEPDFTVDHSTVSFESKPATTDLPPSHKRRDITTIYPLTPSRQAASNG